MYKKGSRVERKIQDYFKEHGFLVMRAAGSGFNTPDLLVFKKGKQFALEVKAHEKNSLYINKEQMEGLFKWEEITGIPVYVVWKKSRVEPLFIAIHFFKKNREGYSITFENALLNGMKKEDLVYGY